MLDSDSQPERRTALIAKELARYTIDVAALQETRLGGQGQIQESTHTFFWIGKTAGRQDAGVAFAISNNIAGKLSSLPHGISERLMHLRIPLAKERFLSVINVYAPTMTYTDEEKEGFYEELAAVVDAVPASDKLLILGDFNALVGKDYRTHRGVLGKFGKGNMNSNGELLLNFCSQRQLCITNSFFNQPDKNFYTWMHPRSKHFHLLDYVVTRRPDMHEVLSPKAMCGAECSTDHYLVQSLLRLKVSLPRRKTRSAAPKKLDTPMLVSSDHQNTFVCAMESALQESSNNSLTDLDNIDSMWNNLKSVTYETATKVLGFPKRKMPDWFQERNEEIQELLAGKQRAYLNHLAKNSPSSKMALQTAKAKVQKEIRSIKDNWWSKKAAELQTLADKNDSQSLFTALRAIYGPRTNAIAPVKTVDGSTLLTDMKDITERWKEHFKNLLNQQDTTDALQKLNH